MQSGQTTNDGTTTSDHRLDEATITTRMTTTTVIESTATTTTTETTGMDVGKRNPNVYNSKKSEKGKKNNSKLNNHMYNTNISDKKQYQNNVITKILGLNVCGLKSKLNNGIFDDYVKNFDILCFSETKLQNIADIDFSGTNLEDYYCHIKEHVSGYGHQYGGVHGICMLVKNNLVKH